VNVKNVATSKNTLVRGFSVFINNCAACYGVKVNADCSCKLVFGNKTNRKKKSVAFDETFGTLDNSAVFVNIGNRYALNSVFAVCMVDKVFCVNSELLVKLFFGKLCNSF
jgi:hypothetical protein